MQKIPHKAIVLTLWVMSLLAIPIWTHFDQPAWDTAIYMTAVHALEAGHDPYADAIALQNQVHAQNPNGPSLNGPYSYVYSPVTLPILRVVAMLPVWLVGGLYWLIYAAGVLTEIWVGFTAVEPHERQVFLYLATVACFFPGFLAADIVLSGNIAYILYPVVLTAAVVGWRTARWRWFYLAVLAASCFKAPLLSLLCIPILSARRQWLPAIATGVAGLTLFGMQRFLWPTLFLHYLQAVELQFSYNRDFGFSPAGLFSGILFDHHIPYSPAASIFYLCYALPLFGFLFYLSRKFLAGAFSIQQWMPVLLVGVLLLNPRLLEYDVAPLAIPLALIGWRFFASFTTRGRTITFLAIISLIANVIAYQSWLIWKLTEGPLLVVFFAAGCYTLLRQSVVPSAAHAPLEQQAVI